MDETTSQNFFSNVRWFNEFFLNMKILFDKISNVIEKETYYNDKWIYYYKPTIYPSIPSTYFLGMEGEGQLKLQIIALFDDEFVKNSYLSISEPSIMIIQHDNEDNSEYIGWNILENKAINKIKEEDGLVSGILEWGDGIEFRSFLLPLDLFCKYDDNLVIEHIVRKLE